MPKLQAFLNGKQGVLSLVKAQQLLKELREVVVGPEVGAFSQLVSDATLIEAPAIEVPVVVFKALEKLVDTLKSKVSKDGFVLDEPKPEAEEGEVEADESMTEQMGGVKFS